MRYCVLLRTRILVREDVHAGLLLVHLVLVLVGSSALLLSVQEIELFEQRVVGFANG